MFIGYDGKMSWFTGVVEDRNDPLCLGRLRVRVMGIHTAQKSKDETKGIPTNELLWMHPMLPINSASMSGIGISPTGCVEGTHVVGFFRDGFCQDGVVIGTLPGFYKEKPDTLKGFCDATGQYPRYIGNDVNVLAGGGQKSSSSAGSGAETVENKPLDVYQQDETVSTAVKPNEGDSDNIIPDDNPDFTIEKMLMQDEGYRVKWYQDHLGYPTIGIGHLIIRQVTKDLTIINRILSEQLGRQVSGGIITPEEVIKLFKDDLRKIQATMLTNKTVGPVYIKLNASRKMALENMCFQMGVGGVAKFKNTLAKMAAGDWKGAHDGMLDSTWAKQTPGRANRVSKIILNGNLESYGVMPKKDDEPTLPIPRIVEKYEDDDGPDPSIPVEQEDTRIMFVEPKSAYGAEYPYNHVYQTESGHTQEFDDTPGKERIKLKHASGTYVEYRPDGGRVTRIQGDDFLIVQQGHNLNVKGNLQIVIEADAQIYVMGNSVNTVDGNCTQIVRGNMTQNVDGNLSQTVKGDVKEQVNGSVNTTVKGDVTQNITGSVNQTINGSATQVITGSNTLKAASWSANIDGACVFNASSIMFNASGAATLKAGGTATVSGSTINLN